MGLDIRCPFSFWCQFNSRVCIRRRLGADFVNGQSVEGDAWLEFVEDGSFSGTNLSFSQLGLSAAGAEHTRTKTSLPLLAALALACLAVGTLVGWKALARPEPAPLLHTMIPAPRDADFGLGGTAPGPAAISPDGTKVAFTARDETGVARLYLRHRQQRKKLLRTQ